MFVDQLNIHCHWLHPEFELLTISSLVARVSRDGAEMTFTLYFTVTFTEIAGGSLVGLLPEGPDHAKPMLGTVPPDRAQGFSTFRYIIPDATASTSFCAPSFALNFAHRLDG